VSILDDVIEHGSIKIITVNAGLLGIAFDDGELTILEPGRHIVDKVGAALVVENAAEVCFIACRHHARVDSDVLCADLCHVRVQPANECVCSLVLARGLRRGVECSSCCAAA
jgi:hypothetical protein